MIDLLIHELKIIVEMLNTHNYTVSEISVRLPNGQFVTIKLK